MDTLYFLDAVKARHSIASDYALAPILGLTRSAVSKFRNGHDYLGDSTAIRVANLLEIDPGIVLAAVHRERAKTPPEKSAWESILKQLGGLAAAVVIGFSALLAPTDSYAQSDNYLSSMKYRLSVLYVTHCDDYCDPE